MQSSFLTISLRHQVANKYLSEKQVNGEPHEVVHPVVKAHKVLTILSFNVEWEEKILMILMTKSY